MGCGGLQSRAAARLWLLERCRGGAQGGASGDGHGLLLLVLGGDGIDDGDGEGRHGVVADRDNVEVALASLSYSLK